MTKLKLQIQMLKPQQTDVPITSQNLPLMGGLRGAFLALLLIIAAFTASAQQLPNKPNPPRIVNDFAGVLSAQEKESLEKQLVQFNNETSTQIAIVTVKSLDGTSVDDFAFKLGEKWGIGQKGKDNGALILVKPKYGNEKGRAFIALGYGLEGVVPDALANRIVDIEMIPHFKNNDYYSGLLAAAIRLAQLTKGEFTAENYMSKTSQKGTVGGGLGIIVFMIIIFLIFLKAGRAKSSSLSGRSNLPLWVFLGMMGSGRNHSGSWGKFSGGGGGGGFGGFGGGSFGGGGAGGSW